MKIKVQFTTCIQDSQEAQAQNPDHDHLVSRVVFNLETEGLTFSGLWADLRQPYGTNYAKEPIEVGRPQGADIRPFNQEAFSDAAEEYYRENLGQMAGPVTSAGGARTFLNSIFIRRSRVYDFEASSPEGGWCLRGDAVRNGAGFQFPPTLKSIAGRVFEGTVIPLEGRKYSDCDFHGCVFHLVGAGPFQFEDCRFHGEIRYGYSGPALELLRALSSMYRDLPGAVPVIEGLFQDVRDGVPLQPSSPPDSTNP